MLLAFVALVGALGLAACTAGIGSSPVPTSSGSPTWDAANAAPPEGRVIGTGTVLDLSLIHI